MKELNIKNRTQVETWWRWYRNEESYRFSQHVGKQYTYGKGLEELSEIERLKLENKRKDIELDILKSTRHWKGSGTSSSHRFSDQLKVKYSIKLILEVLNIPKSTYYRWKTKPIK